METWKTAGWVADSDDEESDLELQEGLSPATKRDISSRPVRKQNVKGKDQRRHEESEDDELAAPAPASRTVKRVYTARKIGPQLNQEPKDSGIAPDALLHDSVRQATPTHICDENALAGQEENLARKDEDGLRQHPIAKVAKVDTVKLLSEAHDTDINSLRVSSDPLTVSNPGTTSPFDSLSSSPLSSPSDSPPAPPTWSATTKTHVPPVTPQIIVPLDSIPDYPLDHASDDEHLPDLPPNTIHGRAFRQRKAIQVHPYILEAERYKKDMHARGVKAALIRQPSPDIREPEAEDEDDSQPYVPDNLSSPHFHPSALSDTHDYVPALGLNDLEELPDLDTILRDRPGVLQRPSKRRKLGHVRTEKEQRLNSNLNHNYHRDGFQFHGPRLADEIPAPLSSSMAPMKKSKRTRPPTHGFQRPPTLPSARPHTPINSSDLETEAQADSSQSSSDVEVTSVRRRRTPFVASDGTNDEPQPDVEDQDAGRVAITQKRIKGVLPASWARLDLTRPQDAKSAVPTRIPPLLKSPGVVRGLARPITVRHRTPVKGSREFVSQVSSDDAPDFSPVQTALRGTSTSDAPLTFVGDDTQAWPDIDDMEDNGVDFMQPSNGARKRSVNKFIHSEPRKRLQQTKLSSHIQGEIGRGKAPRRQRRKQMGILEANALFPQRTKPDFVKVAMRSASARPGQGRSSPKQGAFRLHRGTDNQDIEKVFRNWNANATFDDDTDEPVPLSDISGNRYADGKMPVRKKSTKHGQLQRPRRDTSIARSAVRRSSKKGARMNRVLEKLARKQGVSLPAGQGTLTSNVRPTESHGPGQLEVPILDEQEPPAYRLGHPDPRPYTSIPSINLSESAHPQAHPEAANPLSWSYRPRRRQRRKKQPQPREQYMSDDDELYFTVDDSENLKLASPGSSVLQELQTWSADADFVFGIRQLPPGPLFPPLSFIGSGRFSRCVSGHPEGDSTVLDRQTPWDETARKELSDKMNMIRGPLLDNSSSTSEHKRSAQHLEAMAVWLAHDVYFLDPVDRDSLLRNGISIVKQLSETIADSEGHANPDVAAKRAHAGFRSQMSARLALIAHHLVIKSSHVSVSSEIRRESISLLRSCLEESLSQVDKVGFAVLRRFLQPYTIWSPQSSDDGQLLAEDFVITKVLCQLHVTDVGSLWTYFKSIGKFEVAKLPQKPENVSVSIAEQQWRDLFTLMPLLTIDENGSVNHDQIKLQADLSHWLWVKQLIKPIFEAHQTGRTKALASYTGYCRALLARCFSLIKEWHWQKPDSIVGFIFDFFAKNRLADLEDEVRHQSAEFLGRLNDDTDLAVRSKDWCFDIFLKIIAAGIKSLRTSFQDKKIRGLVWRLIPNHDRQHLKDDEPHEADLDATRNHHDILCTLYWAAPPAYRPGLKLIQNLVQDEGSHREAYRINVQAWLNLVRYQISSDSTRPALEPFVIWHNDLLDRLLRQHALARSEVEIQAKQSEADGFIVSHADMAKMIANNQREVEAAIKELLRALSLATSLCPSVESASVLMYPELGRVFDLFDPKVLRTDAVLEEALSVFRSAMKRDQSNGAESIPDEDEDSQGFGWADIEDFVHTEKATPDMIFDGDLFNKLYLFVSSRFSAEPSPSDTLLRCLVGTWSGVAGLYVKRGNKGWDNFLGPYGRETWAVIADTEQKRKYSPRFLAELLGHDPGLWKEHKHLVISTWLVSLADREALVSFQGDLTAALLNLKTSDPIFDNLPFSIDCRGLYTVTLADIKQKRLSLLCSIFSNMRVAVSSVADCDSLTIAQRRHDYHDLLQQFMQAMKVRYQETGSDDRLRIHYVRFVHQVLKSMQEHVLEICPLDPFFIASSAFPLPKDDEMYVSSKLKAYGLRMSDPKTPKQLAAFLGSVVERAISVGGLNLLSKQLLAAVSVENNKQLCPEFRNFFLNCAWDVYVKSAASDPRGWLFALPLIPAMGRILFDLGQALDGCNHEKVTSFTQTILAVLRPVRAVTGLESLSHANIDVLGRSQELHKSSVLAKILLATWRLLEQLLPVIDYIVSLGSAAEELTDLIVDMYELGEVVEGDAEQIAFRTPGISGLNYRMLPSKEDSLQRYMRGGLEISLGRTRYEEERFLVARGRDWKVVFDKRDGEVTLWEELLKASKRFREAFALCATFEHLVY